jgi:hypothetical protein
MRTTNNRSTKDADSSYGGFPNGLIATGLAISKQSHILHSMQAPQKCLSCRPERKRLSSGLAKPSQVSTSLSRQMHQWLGSRKTSHPNTKGILDKNCVLRSTLQGLPKIWKVLDFNLSRVMTCSDFPSIYSKSTRLQLVKGNNSIDCSDFPFHIWKSTRLQLVKSNNSIDCSDFPSIYEKY